MKHFLALLFVAAALAQVPRKEQWLQIKETSPSKIIRQNFKDGTHTIYDADGSIDATLADNVLTLNDDTGAQRSIVGGNSLGGCGYATLKSGTILSEVTRVDIQCSSFTMLTAAGSTRVRITPDIAGSISRMELLSGGVTLVDFQAGGSGGTFKVALDATGANGVSATTGGLLYTHTLGFYDAAGTLPIGINIAGFGRGGPATMALPGALGSDGDCYKLITAATGQHGYGACGSGGGVTSVSGSGLISSTGGATPVISCPTCGDMTTTTAQDVSGAKKFITTQTFKGNGLIMTALDASNITRMTLSPYVSTGTIANDYTEFALYNGNAGYAIRHHVMQGDGFSAARGFVMSTHMGVGAGGFASHGLTYPGGPVGSQNGRGYYWSLPSSDASGCVQSNGSGVLSISTCPGGGGGVTSVTASSPILSSGGTTPNISCPTCFTTSGGTIAGATLFNSVQVTINNAELVLSGTASIGGTILPTFTGIYDLGSSSKRFSTIHVNNITINGTAGWDLTCGAGLYLFQPNFVKGVLTAGSCSI